MPSSENSFSGQTGVWSFSKQALPTTPPEDNTWLHREDCRLFCELVCQQANRNVDDTPISSLQRPIRPEKPESSFPKVGTPTSTCPLSIICSRKRQRTLPSYFSTRIVPALLLAEIRTHGLRSILGFFAMENWAPSSFAVGQEEGQYSTMRGT